MQELFNIFDEMGFPYFRQGSLSDDNYPESFFTFWNMNTDNDSFYDNDETRYIEQFFIYFYTNNIKILYSTMDEFIKKAKDKGFVVEGGSYDTNSGKIDYFGRVCRINIIHRL